MFLQIGKSFRKKLKKRAEELRVSEADLILSALEGQERAFEQIEGGNETICALNMQAMESGEDFDIQGIETHALERMRWYVSNKRA